MTWEESIHAAYPDPGRFFPNRRLDVAALGRVLLDELHVRIGHDERLYCFVDGVYTAGGETAVRQRARELLGDRYRQEHTNQVLSWLRSEFPSIGERPPPHLLNLKNTLLHWRDGQMYGHSPDILHTVRIPHAWNPDATCPAIDQFMIDVFDGDEALIEFMIEVLGYVLLPENPYRRAVMLLGPGGNGKSVMLAVARALVGDANYSAVSLQKLGEDRFAAAELFGMLANVCGDLDARAIQRTDVFKAATGGDPITGEHKYGRAFKFTPFALMIFSANEAPFSADQSEAWFDRWLVIPFAHRFEGTADCDPKIVAKLTTADELEGLLVRAVGGLRRLDERGRFDLPDAVIAAQRHYRERLDTIRTFIDEYCVLDLHGWLARPALYAKYTDWAQHNGLRYVLPGPTFYERLRSSYGLHEHKRDGIWGFDGIRWREPNDDEPNTQ
jgi:P4 family phage/plasmid primase-like protien